MPKRFDLLLKGGRVVDPSQDLDAHVDVAFSGGRVSELDRNIPAGASTRVLDVSGKLVTPGLIDLHAHVYRGGTTLGVDCDRYSLPCGVTTVVDAGSAGAYNAEGLCAFVAAPSRTRILAFLNIASTGLLSIDTPWESFPAITDVRRAADALRKRPGFLVGVKVRAGKMELGDRGLEPVLLAREAAEEVGVPMMVHIGGGPPLRELLELMRPGDILTHAFTSVAHLAWKEDELVVQYRARGTGKTILDDQGHVLHEVWNAKRRGVCLDVGHGLNSFDFAVCRGALAQGLLPDTISSDLHSLSANRSECRLPALISQFLALGLPLAAALRCATVNPARIVGRAQDLGTLKPSATGDAAVFDLREGHFRFEDCVGQILEGCEHLVAIHTIRSGIPVWGAT